jgi:hypothetical protein
VEDLSDSRDGERKGSDSENGPQRPMDNPTEPRWDPPSPSAHERHDRLNRQDHGLSNQRRGNSAVLAPAAAMSRHRAQRGDFAPKSQSERHEASSR